MEILNSISSRIIVFISILVGAIWIAYSLNLFQQGVLWDLGIYKKAVYIFNNGGDAYDAANFASNESSGLVNVFVYQPLVLRFMGIFGDHLGYILLTLYGVSLVFFFLAMGKNLSLWLSSFLAFAYCGFGLISIGSGNITTFCHLFLISLLLLYLQHKSIYMYLFIFVVTFFSLIKPYFLIYLLIPLLASSYDHNRMQTWISVALCGIIVLATFIFSSQFFGDEFFAFLNALKNQTLEKRDLGYSIAMFFYEYYSSANHLIYRAFVLHFFVLVIVSGLLIMIAKRSGAINSPNFLLLCYFMLSLFNPRLKVYDLFPALITLYMYILSSRTQLFVILLFLFSYVISLVQLRDTPLFIHAGILNEPINVYYLSISLLLFGVIFLLFKPRPN